MFLVLGHSRSGTTYMSQLFQAYRYDVRHETLGSDGLCAWQAAVHDPDPPWGCPQRPPGSHTLIHVVRDPFKVIPSVAHTDANAASMGYRARHVYIPFKATDEYKPLEIAALSVLGWNALIAAQGPVATIRVEDAVEQIRAVIGRKPTPGKLPPTNLNHRMHPQYDVNQIREALRPPIRKLLHYHCERYGYDWPYKAAA